MLNLLTYKSHNSTLSNLSWKVIDFVYPPFCCNCGKIGNELCPTCIDKIHVIQKENICDFCGSYLDENSNCIFRNHNQFYFDQARSWAVYNGPIKKALKKIKYHRGLGVIKELVPQLSEYILEWGINFDFIAPVALGEKRKQDRGYNQSEIIANPIALQLQTTVISNAIWRNRETVSQVGLNFKERMLNVKNAFTANSSICKNKSILLVDDITTTFSTINECASALIKAGASHVYCFTIARTINN